MKEKANFTVFKLSRCFSLILVFGSLKTVLAQGFIDLNFEQAIGQSAPSNYTPTDAANPISSMSALPGWTVREDGSICTAIWGSPIALDETSVALVSGSFSPIQGNYSVQLTAYANAPAGLYRSSSISQTGLIPVGSKSIQFVVASPSQSGSVPPTPVITVNGTVIGLSEISQADGILTLAGDVSSFSGTTADLKILCEATSGNAFPANENYFNLDDIQFSPEAVPEPAICSLLGTGALVVVVYARKCRIRK